MTTRAAPPRSPLAPPDTQPITARLAAAGSRLAELRALIQAAPVDASQIELRDLLMTRNVAGKRSAASREKVWNQLKLRYLLDPELPEYLAFRHAMARANLTDQGLAACVMFGRTDRLFRDLTLGHVSPLLAREGSTVEQGGVEGSIRQHAALAGVEWSRVTVGTIRQHLFSALKDFGVVRGSIQRRTVRPRPGAAVVLFAARLGQMEGLTDRQVLESRWFRLLGLDRDQVADLLYAANRSGQLEFRMQAGVVELRLPAPEAA